MIEGYIALPHSGQVDAALRVERLSLLHRNGSTCSVAAKYPFRVIYIHKCIYIHRYVHTSSTLHTNTYVSLYPL